MYEKIVLKAVVAEFTRSGLEEATVYQVFRHIAALCAMDRMPAIKMSHVCKVIFGFSLYCSQCSVILLEC